MPSPPASKGLPGSRRPASGRSGAAHGQEGRLGGLLLAVALLALLAMPMLAAAQRAPGSGVRYELRIVCPTGSAFEVSTTSVGITCPVRAVDGEDAMGDPSIAVDPFKPDNMIIASLHGSGESQGPDARARSGQVFTTFTSETAGASWYDNPFFPPDDLGSAYGITTGITIDPYGHVYVGSLYATADGGGFSSVVAAQKFSTLGRIDSNQDGAYNAQYLDPVFGGNTMRQLWFLFDPAQDNMTMVWSETLGSAAQPATATPGLVRTGHDRLADAMPGPTEATVAGLPDNVRDAIMEGLAARGAFAAPPNGTNSSSGTPSRAPAGVNVTKGPKVAPRSTIGIAWTTTTINETYYYQDVRDSIGPCSASTNPVLSDGFLYIGCVAAPQEGPFPWHPDTQPGTVELFRMDPSGGRPVYLGASPVVGAHPKLGVRSDGRLALLSPAAEEGRLVLHAAFGRYDAETGLITWSPLQEHGQDIAKQDPAFDITDANVQDMIYREYSGVLHFILKTHVEPRGVGVGSLQATVDARMRKHLVALDEEHGVLLAHDLDIGNIVNRTSDPVLMQQGDAVYDDMTDDFLQMPEGPFMFEGQQLGPAYQREYFAVGDYGQVQFAEVVELTDLRGPAALPGAPAVPAVPAPAASLSASAVLVPSAGLVGSAALTASLLSSRRKNPAAILAKLRKSNR